MKAFQGKEKLPFNSQIVMQITNAIGKFIIHDMSPPSAIESPALRELLQVWELRYSAPSRKYITETFLPKLYVETKFMLEQELQSVPSVLPTHDI